MNITTSRIGDLDPAQWQMLLTRALLAADDIRISVTNRQQRAAETRAAEVLADLGLVVRTSGRITVTESGRKFVDDTVLPLATALTAAGGRRGMDVSSVHAQFCSNPHALAAAYQARWFVFADGQGEVVERDPFDVFANLSRHRGLMFRTTDVGRQYQA